MIIEPVRDLDMFTIKPSNLDSVCPKMHHKKALWKSNQSMKKISQK